MFDSWARPAPIAGFVHIFRETTIVTLTWVTNTSKNTLRMTIEEQRNHRELLSRFVSGEPKACGVYTVSQLEAMGMFGLYREDGTNDR
jgi:hypothetical protein